nr:hypothetical protein CFP56_63997 [Quercus suber]
MECVASCTLLRSYITRRERLTGERKRDAALGASLGNLFLRSACRQQQGQPGAQDDVAVFMNCWISEESELLNRSKVFSAMEEKRDNGGRERIPERGITREVKMLHHWVFDDASSTGRAFFLRSHLLP